jgi:ABC-type spermidine/putrescine transport system permease subunit II
MEQLFNVILPPVVVAIFSGLLIKISLSIAKQSWSNNYQ